MPNGTFKIEKTAASCLLGLIINHYPEIDNLFLSMISKELLELKQQPFTHAEIVEKVVNAVCERRGYQGIIKNSEEQLPNVDYVDYKTISNTYKFYVRIMLSNLNSNNLIVFNPVNASFSSSNSHQQTKAITFLSSCKRKSEGLESLLKNIETMSIDMIDYDRWLQHQNKEKTRSEEVDSSLQQENIQLKAEIQQLKTLVKTLSDKLGDQRQYELANEQLRETIKNLQDTIKDLQEKVKQSEKQSNDLFAAETVKEQFWKQLERSSDENQRLNQQKTQLLEEISELKKEKLQSSQKTSKLEQELRTANTTINALKSPPPPQSNTQFWASSQEFRGGSADSRSQASMIGVWKTTKNPNTDVQWVKNTFNATITPRKKRKSAEKDTNSQQTDSQTPTQKTPSQ